MRHLPNAITVLRASLVPLLAWLLLERDYDSALALFIALGLSDLADGVIARRFNLRTRFGAVADPLADKLAMLTAVLLLAQHGWLPWWFALLVIGRDVLIVGGALAYHLVIGHVDMAPTWLSKANTAFEFGFVACLLALGAGYFDDGTWFDVFLWLTSLTVIGSGTQYVYVWGRKAMRARGTATRP